MVNAAMARAFETVDRRAEDLRSMFVPGVEPNYTDAVRPERIERSRDPLAVVLPEGTFLLTGDREERGYARGGALRVQDGVLVTGDRAAPVLGFAPDATGNALPGPLRIDARDVLLDRVFDARIDPDGVFGYARTVVDPQTFEAKTERVAVGRIALARFPAGTHAARIDAESLHAPSGVMPLIGMPSDGRFGALAVHSRGSGRIDPDAAIARLQDGYLALRALGAAERAKNGMARGAFELVK